MPHLLLFSIVDWNFENLSFGMVKEQITNNESAFFTTENDNHMILLTIITVKKETVYMHPFV